MPHILFGCGDESLELIFLVARSFNEQLRVTAKVSEAFGRKSERHSSRSCAVAIRCGKLGG
jgi:hypothetical protein